MFVRTIFRRVKSPFIIGLGLILLLNVPEISCQYLGKTLGKFQKTIHDVSGTVYIANENTIIIKDFTYDGLGPDAHFWAGDSENPSPSGYIIPDETGSEDVLSSYSNQEIVINLPENKTIKDIKWFAVWCRKFAANFGEVLIPFDLVPPSEQKLGPLPTLGHQVKSDPVVVKDDNTIFIPNFYYDGAAPDAFFLVGNGSVVSANEAVKVPHERGGMDNRIKNGFQGENITLKLPDGLTVFNIDWLSVYCITFKENFGHVTFPKDLNVPPSIVTNKIQTKGLNRIKLPRYKGKNLGDFQETAHKVKGTVYAVNKNSFFIEGFNYDGAGPDAFFWAGSTSVPSQNGFIVPDELGTENVLRAYEGSNLFIKLPKGRTIRDIKWLAVWCRKFTANFGFVMIPDNFQAPSEQEIGKIPNYAHETKSGSVVIKDAKTIRISDLYYDGAAPDAFFLVGMGPKPHGKGTKVPDENGSLSKLKGYRGKDVTLRLPDDLTVMDIDWLGLFCISYDQNFGHVVIPKGLNVIPDINALKAANLQFDNCQEFFNGRMQVWWKVIGDQIYIQIEGTVAENDYMAFGLSGDQTKSKMIGADVAVVFYDHQNQTAKVVDYMLTSKAQCSGDSGACPDEKLGGKNDIELISYQRDNGIFSVTFKRLLNTGDSQDQIFRPSESQSVVAAIGPLNSQQETAYHTTYFNKDAVKIKFGRSKSYSKCKSLFNNKKLVPTNKPVGGAWPNYKIKGTQVFRAQIGPTGGLRGYTAITGLQSWGIAWWINGLLIPQIYVVRGRKYTFIVEGGQDQNRPASYHPLYITNNPEGGVGQTPFQIESPEHKVYAGLRKDNGGNFVPNGVGRYCEFKHKTTDQAEFVNTFKEYNQTIQLQCEQGEAGTFSWMPNSDTPDLVYYQCFTHRNLGWKIHVSNSDDSAPDDEENEYGNGDSSVQSNKNSSSKSSSTILAILISFFIRIAAKS